jgi:hypothetical protein
MKTRLAGFTCTCLIMALGLGLLLPATSQATITLVTERTPYISGSIDWGQLGPNNTFVDSPASITVNVGTGTLLGTVSQTSGDFYRLNQVTPTSIPPGEYGNFALGDKVVMTDFMTNSSSMTIMFNHDLFLFVTQIARDWYGTFNATITALDAGGNPISGGTFTRTGLISTNHADNTAAAIGIFDSLHEIYGIRITVSSPDGKPSEFAINGADVLTYATAGHAPVPGSLLLLGSGLLGLVGWRFRKS